MGGASASVPSAPQKSFGGRWTYAVLLLALLFVSMPFLFWNATWFGRPLADAEISKALANRAHPREIQHALSIVEGRMEKNDPAARQWYPQIAALAGDKVDEIRLTAAWVMGQDTSAPEFHLALRGLLGDPQPMVARNAALSLVRFGDDSGRALVLSMLAPYDLAAPEPGTLQQRLKPGDVVNPGTLVGHVLAGGEKKEVRSVVPGTLQTWLLPEGAPVVTGQAIARLSPSDEMVWEGLRVLYLIGQPADLPAVEPYARAAEGVPPAITQQAAQTIRAIQSRPAPGSLSR